MMQETPEHIFLVIFSAVLQGTSIYLILKSYICKYQKSYWFSVLFISTEIIHKMFRAAAFYWVPTEIWAIEYFIYNVCLFLLIMCLLKGNLWYHLGNIFCGYSIFNLVGTVGLLGVLYLLSGLNFEAAVHAMNYGELDYTGWFFISVIVCTYISKKICDIFLKIKHKRVERFKAVQAFIWIMIGFFTSFEMVFIGIVAFVVLVFICISDQKRKYRKLLDEFAQLNRMNREYTGRLDEMSKVRHDISNHLAAVELTEYYRGDIIEKIAYVEAYTGIRTLDCLLEYKFQICRSEKIKVSVKGCELSDQPVTVYDWVSIFSNLLDNAIEACKSVERKQDRFIRIEMREEEKRMLLRVINGKNPAAEKMVEGEKEMSDPYKDKRGLGLSIVREILDGYHAEIKIENEENIFTVEIGFVK